MFAIKSPRSRKRLTASQRPLLVKLVPRAYLVSRAPRAYLVSKVRRVFLVNPGSPYRERKANPAKVSRVTRAILESRFRAPRGRPEKRASGSMHRFGRLAFTARAQRSSIISGNTSKR